MPTNQKISNDVELYYEKRLRALDISEEANSLTTPVFKSVEGGWIETEETKTHKLLEPCEKGIQINYFNVTGSPLRWRKEGNKWENNFVRIRLEKERTYEKDGKKQTAKYHQEKGSGQYPYLTPGIIKAWIDRKNSQIETLVLIEGEFKALKAWMEKSKIKGMEGVEFMGIPGIHGFYGGDTNHKREINELIQKVIIDCKVKNIVMLLDADALVVKWAEDKDLYIRQKSFANAVGNFRNSLHLLIEDKNVPLSQVYFMHGKSKLVDTAKGLDDLLIQTPAKAKDIFEDLTQFHFAKRWFDGIILTDGQQSTIDKHFGLHGRNQFYNIYKEYIGSRPFIYQKIKYEWTGEELAYVKIEDADRYMRIGIDWVKIIQIPNRYGLLETKVKRWSVAEIKRDYPQAIANRMINEQIPKYDSYHVEPNWDPVSYKRVVYGCYNLMEPLVHEPKPGRVDTTLQFIKHLFQGKGRIWWDEEEEMYKEEAYKGDQFTVAMDYLTIQLQHPKEMLPVPCLVSPENGTGKSTFIKWLCMVYNGNGTVLNNDRFKMNFNGHYATKFIIGLDEGFLEVDKKAEKEKLKQLVTSDTIFLENKGMDIQEIPYYGKLIICSNDADNLMKMEDEETRWFVVKVPKLRTRDPFMVDKMKEEIPAWIHFLANRKVFHEKKDRLWFEPQDFITDQMREIVEVTKNQVDASVENWVKEMFLTYKIPELKISRPRMLHYINETKKYKIDEEKLKYYMEKKRGFSLGKTARCKIPSTIVNIQEDNTPHINYYTEIARPYILKPEEWLNEIEMKEFKSPWAFKKEDMEDDDDQTPSGSFEDQQSLDDKQYKQEELWQKKKGPAPF
ncbi:hypothetical protein DN752_17955 [Echinicola strongylocentroti]|uniref:NrS-1 polymerase-like helicase domain-containing protein n=1 Tax=Echinicola strongylocentroti TaxID=1795355 RepID=A0A2Z4ILQ4_9BACT|nr:DUF5906 domain-containing protein [Echinicola strongylocentroti]AWW31865.1 hypothetical protein DN752_17955 [Echinicola strongylocentroti]